MVFADGQRIKYIDGGGVGSGTSRTLGVNLLQYLVSSISCVCYVKDCSDRKT